MRAIIVHSEAPTPTSCHHVPAFPTEIGRPVVHQVAPALEQVRARVGRLDLVLDDMRQRRLNDLAWMIGLFGRPVAEGRPEPVLTPLYVKTLVQAAWMISWRARKSVMTRW